MASPVGWFQLSVTVLCAFLLVGQVARAGVFRNLQDFEKRRLENEIQGGKGKCLFQTEACEPYKTPCCPGMKCANTYGSYCKLGVVDEVCMCVPHKYGRA